MSSCWCLLVSILLMKESLALCTGTTCEECMSSAKMCTWCSKPIFSAPRCQPKTNLLAEGCDHKFIDDPQSVTTILQNQNVTDGNQQNGGAIHIQPQRVHLVTRTRKEHKLTMTFRASNNFPVDIYFLFDTSMTMEPQLKILASLADSIGESISRISSNYLMGYGVFQDKIIMPFTDVNSKTPCGVYNSRCSPPFEFMHLLKMTRNTTEFTEKINKTMLSGNIDHPEGTLDAIVQAITCKSEIGWRDGSHKLLIVASNGRFHWSGDGRLGGIVIPNDGRCHLDSVGRYARELEQDYPSVGQLADTVAKNEVHIIFAVTNDQVSLFKELCNRIPNSILQLLASPNETGKRNIKDIIEQKITEMLSEVEIVHNKVKGIDINIQVTSEHCERNGTNKCKSLKKLGLTGVPITFEVNLLVTECPASPEEHLRELVIYPASMKNDQLVLEIDTLCECSCTTDSTKWEINGEICSSGNGTLKCGLCDYQDCFGQSCESDPTTTSSDSGCIRCQCSVCKCSEGYSDNYCECSDQSCGYFRGEICGGVRGHCDCGECICQPEYTGTTCECPISNFTCINNKTVCSDAGVCECGECQCKEGYIGVYCEICLSCGSTVCDIPPYRGCAECIISDKMDECPENCPEIKLVDTLENINGSDICSVTQADGCYLPFRITINDPNITILVQKTATCQGKMNAVTILLSVVGGVVSFGLLLMILWNIVTSIFDRIMYSKLQDGKNTFKGVQQDHQFFKGTTSTYRNPLLDTSGAVEDDQ